MTRLVVGRVRGLHGLRGHVRIEVLTDRPDERFARGRALFVEGADVPLTIASAAPVADGPGWRLRFDEVPDRTSAERLRDAYLEVDVDRSVDLAPGAAYWHEIVGAEVRGSGGRVLGRVMDVYRAGEAEVYVVRGAAGEIDVPAVRDVITEFAPERGYLVVDEGVLDVGGEPVDERPPSTPRRRPRWSHHGKGAGERAERGPDARGGASGGGAA